MEECRAAGIHANVEVRGPLGDQYRLAMGGLLEGQEGLGSGGPSEDQS